LFVLFCTQIFEKNDCSRRMRKVVFNPPNMQPYPFFSKILLKNPSLHFFWWKTVLQFPPEKFLMRTIALVRTIASRETDLWLKCARERCNVTSQRGAWSLSFFLGQTCAQTWPMRMMSDLTCTFPVRMCNHSLEVMLNYQRAMSRP
jgi:hypothetical protein